MAGLPARVPGHAPNALRQLWSAARFRAVAATGRADAGAEQRRRPAGRSTLLAKLARAWQVPHAAHPDAGHDLPLDDGAWVAGQVAGWLRQLE
jgi:hypothetical protein